MTTGQTEPTLVGDELEVLAELVPIAGRDIVELGCGAAALARALLKRHPDSRVTGLEVDARQHAKNLASPQPGLQFVAAGAQAIPFPDASFDVALMLESLHHVPLPLLAQALGEVGRVLRPRGWLYVCEPVYAGALNELTRRYNDEGVVRAAAQAALDAALGSGAWEQVAERFFEMPVSFRDFADFEQRMMRPTFVDHRIDDAKLAEVGAAFAPHLRADGAHFTRPMHVRVLRKRARGRPFARRRVAHLRSPRLRAPMRRYDRCLLPHLVNCVCGSPMIERQRRLIVPQAAGRVLEIGFGSGLNLPHYDRTRAQWVRALEPSAPMRSLAAPGIAAAGLDVRLPDAPGEDLPLPNHSVDNGVVTFSEDRRRPRGSTGASRAAGSPLDTSTGSSAFGSAGFSLGIVPRSSRTFTVFIATLRLTGVLAPVSRVGYRAACTASRVAGRCRCRCRSVR